MKRKTYVTPITEELLLELPLPMMASAGKLNPPEGYDKDDDDPLNPGIRPGTGYGDGGDLDI